MFVPAEVVGEVDTKVFDRIQRVQDLSFKLIDMNIRMTVSCDV